MSAARSEMGGRASRQGFLSLGFRPFFLLGGLWAIVAVILSVPTILGLFGLPVLWDPVSWHLHEMLFGYVAAAMAGFLLTAVPNWTGRRPCAGWPLLLIVGLWLAGRILGLVSAVLGALAWAVLDSAFLFVLWGVVTREVLAAGNHRNLPVCLALGLFWLTNLSFHAEQAGLVDWQGASVRGALSVVLMLLVLIGGRITPNFTRNWLNSKKSKVLPAEFGPVDKFALAVTLAAFIFWIVSPSTVLVGALALVAAAANLYRLARWKAWLVLAEPLLWSLHLGYLWVCIGFLLLALAAFGPVVPEIAAIHVFSVGGMGTMTLVVMSRATLGHSGRLLRAGGWLSSALWLMTLSVFARLAAALVPQQMGLLVMISLTAWVAAFVAFLIACGPVLLNLARK